MVKIAAEGRTPEEDREIWRRFRGALGEAVSPAAQGVWIKIAATAPPPFDFALVSDPNPADASRGQAVASGVWRAGEERFTLVGGEAPWTLQSASLHFLDRVHRFDWLPHLAASGEAGPDQARQLVDQWIADHGQFDGFSWRAGTCMDRLWNWTRCGRYLLAESELPQAAENAPAPLAPPQN